jgi:biotin carboxyl carrier protein
VGALLLPVRAPHDGTVKALVAPDGKLAGFGDPLVELSP